MSATGEGAGGGSPDGAGAGVPPGPDGQCGHGRADDPGEQGAPEGAGATAPRVVPAEDGRGPHGPPGDVVPAPGAPENRMLVCTLNVPTESPLVAEYVRRIVTRTTRNAAPGVNREVSIRGCVINVWTEEDPLLLRTSTNCFLEQLDLVMHNIPAPLSRPVRATSRARRGNT